MARVTLQQCCDQARELIAAHKYADAIAVCRHILKRYPRHIRTYQLLGEACLENRELPEAVDAFKRLLENADPENLAAYAGLGFACEDKGRLGEAIWYFERAFELAPNNEETRNTLRRLYRQRDGVEPDRIRHSKAALARLYTRGGQTRQAIEEFRRLLELEEHRDRLDLKVSLVEALWRDGRREQAAELAREVLQAAPDCLKAILLLGKIALEKGRSDEGRAILERARGLDPENRVAQALFGETSPLPPAPVLIPGPELQAEASITPPATVEAAVQKHAIALVAEEAGPAVTAEELAAEEPTPAVVDIPVLPAEKEVTPVAAPEALGEEAPAAAPEAVVPPLEEQVVPPRRRRKRVVSVETEEALVIPEVQAAEVVTAMDEAASEVAAEAVGVTPEEIVEETPASVSEPAAPTAVEAGAVAAEKIVEEVSAVDVDAVAPLAAEIAAVAPEVTAEEALGVITESVAAPVAEEVGPTPEEQTEEVPAAAAGPVAVTGFLAPALEPVEAKSEELPAAIGEAVAVPVAEAAAPRKRRSKRAAPRETALEAMAGVGAGPLSDIERCQLLLEQKPKNEELRLALARAYRDGAQMKLAIEQYGMLVRAKNKLLPEVIADVESIVASRPDNLDAHELLADLYGKNGQLQKALERYRWVLERLREG